MKITSFYLILCLGLLTLQTSSGITNSSLAWDLESIRREFGAQINWDVHGYFERDQGTVSTWTTVGLIIITNDNGETITYEETGSGTSIHYPDHEFIVEITTDEEMLQYDLFHKNETDLNSYFSITYDSNKLLLSLDEIIVFIIPTIIDNNSEQINLFNSESNFLEYQDLIRSMLNLSTNSTFQYDQGTYAPFVIRDINDQYYRYHSSGVLTDYLMKNSTHNIRIELDNRYIVVDLTTDTVVDDMASDFPYSSITVVGFVFIIFLRRRSRMK